MAKAFRSTVGAVVGWGFGLTLGRFAAPLSSGFAYLRHAARSPRNLFRSSRPDQPLRLPLDVYCLITSPRAPMFHGAV